MKLPARMEPQPLQDASLIMRLHNHGDRSTSLSKWVHTIGRHFSQMDMSWRHPSIEEGFEREMPLGTPRFFDDRFSVQIQNDGIFLQTVAEYPGWSSFQRCFVELLEDAAKDFGGTFTVHSLGLRYLNFFEGFDKISDVASCEIQLAPKIEASRHSIRVAGERDGRLHDITATDNVQSDSSEQRGVILDIAAWKEGEWEGSNAGRLAAELDDLHRYEKELFTSLLNPAYLERITTEWEVVDDG